MWRQRGKAQIKEIDNWNVYFDGAIYQLDINAKRKHDRKTCLHVGLTESMEHCII